jgi:hypothetical protein
VIIEKVSATCEEKKNENTASRKDVISVVTDRRVPHI